MRRLIIVLLVLVLLAAAGIGAFLWLRSGHAEAVDTWIGKQVVRITASYLEPAIDFKSLEYTAPYRVEMKGATLTARDGTRVAEAGSLVLELAEIPQAGRPIRIRSVVLAGASVNLVEDASGGFKGLVPFVRGTRETRRVEEDVKLSTVLRLEHVELRDAAVRYQPADGSPPMVMSGLTMALDVTRSGGEEGWYEIDTSVGRAPQLTAHVKGAVNLDTLVAKIAACEMAIEVSDATMEGLPPALQSVLRDHEARGKLRAGVTGTVPLMHVLDGEATAWASVSDFNVAEGEYHVPVPAGDVSVTLRGGVVELTSLAVRLLGGALAAQGRARLAEPDGPAEVRWRIERVNVRDLLRAGVKNGEQPRLAGILDAQGSVRTSLADARGKLSGEGGLSVKEGRLFLIPGLKQLAAAMSLGTKWLGSTELSHSAEAKFLLSPTGVEVTSSQVDTEFLTARGTGVIRFDGTMDMEVNAGPLEKAQGFLGKVGQVIGSVTDRLLKYRVHGPVANPQVQVLPLGLGG